MAKAHPLKFIAFILGLLVLFIISSTDMFAIRATGQGQLGAVEYIHVDTSTNAPADGKIEITVALTDQQGKPVAGRTYGVKQGQFSIPTNGLTAADGSPCFFSVDAAKVKEIKDASGEGTGVYIVPVTVGDWAGGQSSPVYTLKAEYRGGGADTGDDASGEAYKLTATTTLNTPGGPDPAVLKYIPAQTDKISLNVPEWRQGEPEPAAAVKTIVFRIKLIGQARDAVTGSRMFKGRAATPEEIAKWLPPFAYDSAGRVIKAEYGRIKEEQVPYFGFRRGEWRGTGVYEVEVKLLCPADLAGKKGVITIGRTEGGVSLTSSASVNFQSSGVEEKALPNPYFANPYFYDPPSTPTVTEIGYAGVVSGGTTVEFPAGTTQFPTNGDYIISETGDRTAVTNLRLRATVEDPDGYNISAAEYFKQTPRPDVTQDGTGTAMVAEPPGFSSDPILPDPPPALSSTLVVRYDIPSATVKSYGQAQHDFWVHGKSALGNWGSGPANYGTTMLSVDLTKPTAVITKPVTDEYVRGAYRVEGDASKQGTPVYPYESDLNVVQVYDEVTGDFTDLAENDSGRGGTNFSKWYYIWDSTAADDGKYVFRARPVDLAGNIGDEAQVSLIADNVKPITNVTVPLEGHGWDNSGSYAKSWDLTGIVYDPNMPPVGTLVKSGSSDANATDRTNIGGSWSGNNLTADRMLTGDVTLQGSLSMVANSILAWGSTVKTGTTATNAADRSAIGGVWSGNTLTTDVTMLNNATIHGTVVLAASSIIKLPATIQGADSFNKYTFEWGTGRKGAGDTTGWNIPIGGSWTGGGPYTLSADRTTVLDAVQGTLTSAAGTTFKAGTVFKGGTTCTSSVDRDAIGGSWFGTGPYTLGSDRTTVADVTLAGTVTAATGSVYKIGSTFKAGTTCTDVNDTLGTWAFAGGHAGGANQINPAAAMGVWDTTGLTAGDYSLRITGLDKAGNVNLDRTGYPPPQEADHMNRFYVHIDTVAPAVAITPAVGGWWMQTIYGTASDDISGVDKVEILLERTDTTQYWNGTGWVGAIPASWPTATIDTGRGLPSATWHYDGPDNTTLPRNTTVIVHARATDDVKNIPVTTGHVSPEATSSGSWDPDKPTTSVPGGPTGDNGWYKAPAPSFTISAADVVPGSGMNGGAVWYVWTTQAVAAAPASGWTQLAYAASPVSINAPTGAPDANGVYVTGSSPTMPDGKYRLWYRGRDLSGNIEVNHYSDFKVDATAPPVPTIYAEQTYWYGSDLGEAAYTEGTANTEYGTIVTDGNLDSGVCTYFYQRATDSGFTTGLVDSSTWQSQITYIGWPIYNNAFYYQFTGLVDAQIYYYRVKSKDYAGNESSYSGSQSSTQDNIGPVLNQNSGTAAPNTWYNTNKTVQIWVTDTTGGSGPKGFRWAWDGSPGNDWLNMSVAGGATGSTTFPGVGKRTLHVIGYDRIYTATASDSFTYDHLSNYEPKHRTAETDYEFWYDPYPPYNWQSFSYPAAYDGWSQTKSPTCTISIQDDIAVPSAVSGLKVTEAKFAYSSDGGGTWSAWLAAGHTGSDGSINPETLTATGFTFAGDSATLNKVKFQIPDMAGSVVESSAYIVKVDSTAPTVTSTVPANDPNPDTPAPLVAPDTPIRATFDDDMLTSTVNDVTNFTLEMADPGLTNWSNVSLLSASYNPGTKTVNVVPTTMLTSTKKYRMTVTVNVKDKAGNPMAVAYSWYWYVSDVLASIDWPYPGNTVYGTIPVHGVASGSNAKFYKLQYGAGAAPGTWFDITDATGTTNKSYIFTQTDWSDGPSGGGAPEVVTTLLGYKKFWQSAGVDATSDAGAIRLAKAAATGGWYNQNWIARKRILVTNPNASALYNYQVKLTVNWTADMKTDFSDLRFTDYDKTSLLDYWVESYTTGVSATVWVEVPNIVPAGGKAVYMYYGNPAASSTSSVANTFLSNQIFLRTFYNNVSSGAPPYYLIQNHANFDTYITLMGETGYGFYGSGYVDRVDHTVNPYGASDYYTSQYKFLFVPTVGGNYKFGTNSDSASEAIKNTGDADTTHTALVGWYGNHGVGTQFDDHSATYGLTANVPVWLEYRQNNSDNTGRQAQMGIMVPGQAWATVNTTNFAGQIYARNYATVEPTATITDEGVYEATGSLTSSVIDGGGTVTWGAVAWTETINNGTDVTVQVKTSADNLTWTDWSYPRSVAGGDLIPSGIASARYIQYKINLKGNAAATRTPVVSDITLFHTPLGTWNTTTVADGAYTIRLLTTIADPADWSPDNILEARVTVNVQNHTAPESTIVSPITSSYIKARGVISGTATDTFPGIGAVDLRIRRGFDNNYWTGSGWSGIESWAPADSDGGHNAAWSLTPTSDIFASGQTYYITSRATDLAGEQETTLDTITLYGDNVPPNITLDFPKAPNNYVSADYVGVNGAASDANLRDYKVEYQKNGSSLWTQIGTTHTSVNDGFYQSTTLDFKPDPTQSDADAGFNGTRAIDGKVMLGRRGSTAQYPNQASLETNFAAAGFNSSGSGVVATDGAYLYVKRYGTFAGPASFNKVGTGYGGTTAGVNYGQLNAGIYSDSVSAFYLDGYVYNGYTSDGNTLERQNVATGAVEYVQMGGNTIPVPRGRPGSFDYANAGIGSVIKDGTTYKMWYSGHDGANWRIGYAESTDGITWTKNPNPVIDLGGFGSWDDNAVYYPTVVKDGATYKMWYSGHDHANVRTGYATSSDGITWTKYAGNPVMNLGGAGEFDSTQVQGPTVLQEGPADYKMWYGGSNGSNWRIGYATSSDGITWTKYASNPVVPLGSGWESTHTFAPTVIKEGTTYKMWYSGSNGTNWKIGYATSTDATTWTKSGSNPVVSTGAANTFDATHAVRPTVILDGGTYKMWYAGHDGLRWAGEGYATSANGVAWTKNPAAPVVGDRLLKRNGATDLTMANTNAERADLMVTTDGRYVYSIGANGTTNWKVRIFDSQNNFAKVGDFTTVMDGFTAYNTYGFIADGFYIYPIEAYSYTVGSPYNWGAGTWPGDNSRVTRIGTGLNGTTSGEIVNQWYEGAWGEFEVNGQYDPLNRKIWMGMIQGGTNIYRFNAGDESTTSGTYASRIFDMGPGATTGTVSWTAATPGGTSLTVETRVSSVRTFSTEDTTVTSNWATVTNGGVIPNGSVVNPRFVQYRLTMTGPGGATSPSLDDITLRYAPANSVLETWRVVDMTEGQYKVRVTGVDRAGNEVVATADPVYVDKTPPTASLDTLLNLDGNNTGYVSGTTVGLTGVADDTNSWAPDDNIANWTIEHKRTGAAGWTTITTNTTKVPPASFGVWDTTIAVPEGTEDNTPYAVRLRVTDKAGLTRYTNLQSVFIDNSTPAITSTIPPSGATNVDSYQNLTAYFDDLIYAPSVTSASFLLNGGAIPPAGVIYADQLMSSYATFVLASPLTMNTSYTASLTTAVHNKAGRAIPATAWSFTTSKVDAGIYLPMANAHVAGTYPVMGRGTGSQFGEYKLEYAEGRHDVLYGGPWYQIGNTATGSVLSQSNVQTTWNNAVNPNTNPVSFGMTSDQYYAKDANVITTNPGYVQLGSSNVKWLSSAWSTRKPVTVNNTGSAAALTDYQVQVTVTFASGMKADFSDLRFTDTDGQTLLNYWIEKYTASASATAWVKVPAVAAGSNKTIYMYYGNAGAPNGQNPSGTFDFFDGFDTGSTINAARWNTSAALGFLQAGARSQLKATSTGGRLTSNTTFSYPIVIEAREMSTYLPPNGISVLGFYGSSSNSFGVMQAPGTTYYRNDANWLGIGNLMVEDTWYRLTIEPRTQFRARYKIVNDGSGSVLRDETVTNAVSGEPIALGKRYDDSYSEPTSTSWDWVLARKYALVEPTVSAGSADSYQNSGIMSSVVFDGGSAQNWKLISWTENVPKGANITVETRTGDVPAPDGTWTAWSAPSSYSGGTVIPAGQQGKRYIQYRVSFYGNGATLLDVTIWHSPLIDWTTTGLTDGPYTLRLMVTDTAGDWSDSHVLRKAVPVNLDNAKPVVTITDPPDNNQLTTNMKTVTGTASDLNAGVRKVEFKVNTGVWNTAIGTSRVNSDTPSAVYAGTWTTYSGPEPSDGTSRETNVPGSSVTYTFTGTAVNLIAKRGPNQGYATVQVDAETPITVDLYSPIAIFQQTVFSQTGLSTPGPHTLTVTSTGTSNPAASDIYINVDAFETGGAINWTYDWVTNSVTDGPNNIFSRATDAAGNLSDEAGRTITVDNIDPTSAITSPLANSAFTSDQPVNGTANDTNFEHYDVDFSYGAAAEDWIPIGTGMTPVISGNLATWTAPTRTPMFDWQTDGDPENWCPQQGITNISVTNGSFNGRTTGTAPYYIKTPAKLTINGNETKVLKIRMKVSDASGYAKLFWKYTFPYYGTYLTVSNVNLPLGEQVPTSQEDEWGYPTGTGASQFGESRRMIKWPVINPGEYVEYTVDMSLGKVWVEGDPQHDKAHPLIDYSQIWPTTGFWAGTVYQLRFDPSDVANVDFNIDHMSLASADGNYKIRLTTHDQVGRSSETSQYPVMIDRNTPACIISSPVNMTFLASGTGVSVAGTATDDLVNAVASGVEGVDYRIIQNVDSFAPTVGPWLPVTTFHSVTMAANSQLKTGSVLRAGTVCSNVNDKNAIGGTWTGSGPYTLAANVTLAANRTMAGTLTMVAAPVFKATTVFKSGTTTTSAFLRDCIGGTWSGTGPYTLTADRTLGIDTAILLSWYTTANLPAGWHGLQARAYDRAGNIQESNYSYVTVDGDAPPVPRIRAMADRNRGGILLSWTPVKDPGSGTDYYVLYRGNTPVTTGIQYPDGVAIEAADGELVTKDFGNGPETFRAFHASNAIDTAFTPNTNTRYYIRAVDQVGNYSAKGSISGLYDTQPPTTPSNLTATRAGTTTSVQLAWNPSTDNQQVAEYRIHRIVKPGSPPYDFTPGDSNKIGVATVTGTFFTTKFFDSNLAENTSYLYKVVAYDDSLIPSEASNVAEVAIGTKQIYSSTLPHKTFSSNSDQCVMCHRTHTGPGKNLLKRTYEADTCYTCHDGTGSNTPTKAEFDSAPNGLHRVKDDIWPSGALSCIDCHNPHLNTEKASYENFDSIPLGAITSLTKPPTWTFSAGDWAATGNSTHVELSQTNALVDSLTTFDTGINIAANGGYFSTIIRFDEAGGEAYYSLASNGLTAGNGVTLILDSNTNTYKLMLNGSVVPERTQSVTITPGTVYRIKVKLDEDKTLNAKLYTVAKSELPTGHDVITDTLVGSIKHSLATGDYKGSNVSLGTFGAKVSFDQVHVNVPGMLQNRYRKFYKSGTAEEYTVPDDRVLTEAFCLSCHGSSADDPGGSHTQYYSSIHNPLMGGMNDQSLDQENTGQVKSNPAAITPRWQTIRAEWKDIKTNPNYKLADGRTIGELLKGTSNGCLYCHGYHGQQWYDKNASGEEELCYMCHGRIANYSRDGWNVYRQYSGYVEDTSARIDYSGTWTTITGPQYGGGSTKRYDGPRTDWYNTSWSKRQPVTINNTGGAVTGYQVKLSVGYDTAMKTDFSDLRFADTDGITLLPYWIETYTTSNRAIVWVKTDLPAASTKKVYMYFNNPAATDGGNGNNVFEFFDDFNDGAVDLTKWVERDNASNYITESGGTLNVSGGPSTWGTIGMYSVPNLARPFIFEVSQKYTGGNYNMIGVKNTTSNISYTDLNYAGYNIYDGSGNRLAVYEDGNSRGDQLHALSAVDWNYEKFTVKSTGAVYYHGDTPQNYAQYYNSTYSSNSPERVGFANYNQAFKLDNARVRKYAATEPGASFGTTELPGGARYGFDSDYVNVYCETGPGKGTIRIFVDNVEQTPVVDLASFPAGTNTLVFSKTGLTTGTRHAIDIMPFGAGEVDLDAVKGSGSKHGLTMLEATIKCTSCHGQRAMTDRHVYEGFPTSVITNPNNIKQYWSDQRMTGKTINDYCNACHKEADRKGRVLIETHTSSKIVPYTIKYPPMVTTPSANGFDRTGYTLGDAYTAQENFPGVNVNNPADWTTVTDDLYDGGAARYSATPLAWLEYSFQGSSIAFVTKRSASYGYAQIYIDGAKITDGEIALADDPPNAKSGFDLYSAVDLWTQAIYTKTGLDPTVNHTIRVIVVGNKNALSTDYRVDVDAFRFTVPRVGHYLYLAPFDPLKGRRNCASTCHDGLAPYIRDSQEASTKITCTTCHHPHASDNNRLVHQPEDYTEANGTVHKGACLHCHDGSVTK